MLLFVKAYFQFYRIFGNTATGVSTVNAANALPKKVSYGLSSTQGHSTAPSDGHIRMLKWTVYCKSLDLDYINYLQLKNQWKHLSGSLFLTYNLCEALI